MLMPLLALRPIPQPSIYISALGQQLPFSTALQAVVTIDVLWL